MKFTVEPEPLIRMVEMVGERVQSHKSADVILRIVACEGLVCIESNHTVAEMGVIWKSLF
jgi:hypothetical protein